MASFDSSLSEADRMAQGACDGAGTTGPDYVSSGGFIGTGPDGARQFPSVALLQYRTALLRYASRLHATLQLAERSGDWSPLSGRLLVLPSLQEYYTLVNSGRG